MARHNVDLIAARASGCLTAFVRQPLAWAPAGPPDPNPQPDCSLVVTGFPALAKRLGA